MSSQLGFFAVSVPPPTGRIVRPQVVAKNDEVAICSDEEAMARHLEATGNYRILRKLQPRRIVGRPRPEFRRHGVILDTETTGLNYRFDEIIEIGAIAFTFNDAGAIGDVTGVYGGLQQPTIPIPPDITRLRIYAENSPFDMKDHLKARGYRWSDGSDGRPKSWWIELPEEKLEEELHFLRTEIYRWDADPPVKYLTALDRFWVA
ncbi:exonuclease domain-containing protein [Shinella sp.]|uniref:exonuclease domain-containing protein n=1 Tax=Shinella sp. TaxID=1870904 RepID=UPI003F6F9FC8